MKKDFTITIYKKTIDTILSKGFAFQTFSEYLDFPLKKCILLRHDVDRRPKLSLQFAQFQQNRNIRGTYFFRITQESFEPEIITEIAELGHEIGYHYEDVDLAYRLRKAKDKSTHRRSGKDRSYGAARKIKVDDLLDDAIELFEKNLNQLRKYYPVKTICMHGSPLSPFDNKALWTKYDYRDFGIIGEPYFDIDFNEVAYYTDTGRKWDGEDVSVRDKVKSKMIEFVTKEATGLQTNFPSFHSTFDIITSLEKDTFPKNAMLTFHPQRWTDNTHHWIIELIYQRIKNVIKKYYFIK